MTLAHQDLVRIAARYLRDEMGCGWATVAELAPSRTGEQPDAFGYSRTLAKSIVIECKASPEDFKADLEKPSRYAETAMGDLRFYMCEPGTIPRDRLPANWGLLVTHAETEAVTLDVESMTHGCSLIDERRLLAKALAKAAARLTDVPMARERPLPKDRVEWLAEITSFVLETGGCYASDAIRWVGTHTYRTVIKAADEAVVEIDKGRCPDIVCTVVGARPYLSPKPEP